MIRRRHIARILLGACLLGVSPCLAGSDPGKVRLDLFYSPGCADCERLRRELLPELDSVYGGLYELAWHDLTVPESVPLLLAYQERGSDSSSGRVTLVVDHSALLVGYRTLATGLVDRVAEALERRLDPAWRPPQPPRLSAGQAQALVEARGRDLTLPVVLFGGLTDGFNPCATATLIFFLSVLAAARASARTRLLTGSAFIAASFLTYFGIGVGILAAFRRIPSLEALRRLLEIGLGLCMLPLAWLSFRDALRFRRTPCAEAVTLQVPGRIKQAIHAFTRSRLGAHGPVLGGWVAGAGVTLLESVCTGQGYAPVLAYLLKSDGTRLRTLALLALYNLLFVLPLLILFLCFHRGLQLRSLIEGSRRHLSLVKILLGVFFTVMALLLLAPR